MPLLYHVTRTANSELIKREGFAPGSPTAESGIAEAIAEAELAGEQYEEYDTNELDTARDDLNEFMRYAHDQYPDKPEHGYAVYFWSTMAEAQWHKRQIEQVHGEGSAKVDIIDTDKAGCTFWSASSDLAEELYNLCLRDPIEAMNCLMGESEGQCESFDEIAHDYYKNMKQWNGKPQKGREILTSCLVPPSAITKEIDPPKGLSVTTSAISNGAKTLNKQIAVAIPTEGYYRDEYREMSIEAEHEGDKESANTLEYISGDEEEHRELLKSVQCRREPEKCQYGPKYEHPKEATLMNDQETIREAVEGQQTLGSVMNDRETIQGAIQGQETVGSLMNSGETIREAVEGQQTLGSIMADPPAGLTIAEVPVSATGKFQESTAAEHFGRAICLGRADSAKPSTELTDSERRCIQDVGTGWERAIVSRFEESPTPIRETHENANLVSPTGQHIGRLTLNNGVVTMCLNTGFGGEPTGSKCAEIGAGFDSFVAANQMLGLWGIQVQPS